MTAMTDRLPATNELTAIAERASLYEMLVAAMKRQRKPQPLPTWLYADIGLEPSQDREFVPRGR
ncbi:MAG: hypothetical protein JWR51_1074 [Devosia sp.]|uniref:hypothetical protein n=1 Tax=Devosia sp. TaxID=1871048 RepID=UPI00260DBAE8|nr:hypothetical protein [Devosia sp.]MDB5527971.1 hypothetical protein [Devosia sp.]